MKITGSEVKKIDEFIESITGANEYTRAQYEHSYSRWIHGGSGWNCMRQGGTGIMQILMWYHHVHKPGSKEWRPSIIIKDLLTHLTPAK